MPFHPIRFGLINETVYAPAEFRRRIQQAEALGYATWLIRDHLAPDFFGPQYAPLAVLATAAALTTRLRIGTLVLSNDFRHPALLAKELATLDLFSGGRLEIGLGAGWLRTEYEQAGLPYDANGVRVRRLAEAVTLYKALLRGEPVTHSGEFYQVNGLQNFPLPVQRPHPPLLIGAGQQRMLQLAGREADIVGMLTTSVVSGSVDDDPSERLAASVQQKLAWVQEGAGSRFEQLELSLFPSLFVEADRHATAARLIAERRWQGIGVDDVLAMPSICIGTLDEIAQQLLERRARYGFSYFILSDGLAEFFAPLVERLQGA